MINMIKEFELYAKETFPTESTFEAEYLVRKAEKLFQRNGFRLKRKQIKEILIIRSDEIGDMVLMSGFLREVRRIYAKAKITLVVTPVVYPLVEYCPYVDNIYRYDCIGENNSFKGLLPLYKECLNLCEKYLWEKRFDLCFSPRWEIDNRLSLLLGYLSGAKERIGYSELTQLESSIGLDLLLTKVIFNPSYIFHETAKNFYMLESMGHLIQNKSLEIWLDKIDQQYAEVTLAPFKEKSIIAIALGGSSPKKMWDVRKYALLVEKISKNQDYNYVLLGSSAENKLGENFKKILSKDITCLNLIGKTNLRQVAAILAHCKFYIGNDTSLMHMAAVYKVAILSPNCYPQNMNRNIFYIPERIKPWETISLFVYPINAVGDCNKNCSAYGCISEFAHCINEITVEQMFGGWKKIYGALSCSKKRREKSLDEADRIHIAFCTDRNYASYMGVAITSIILNNHGSLLSFHIIYDYMQEEDYQRLKSIECIYKNVVINFYKFTYIDEIYKYKNNNHVTSATYMRLYLADILAQDISKILYLDCDVLCINSLRDLWGIELKKSLAWVKAIDYNQLEMCNKLNLKNNVYFNAGVILIDLDKWRKLDVKTVALKILSQINMNKPHVGDQDILNQIFDMDRIELENKYNKLISPELPLSIPNTEDVFLHYFTYLKPWQKWYSIPIYKESILDYKNEQKRYFSYVNRSLWYGMELIEPRNIVEAIKVGDILRRDGSHKEANSYYRDVINSLYYQLNRESK